MNRHYCYVLSSRLYPLNKVHSFYHFFIYSRISAFLFRVFDYIYILKANESSTMMFFTSRILYSLLNLLVFFFYHNFFSFGMFLRTKSFLLMIKLTFIYLLLGFINYTEEVFLNFNFD